MQATVTANVAKTTVIELRRNEGFPTADQCALCPTRALCWSAHGGANHGFTALRLARRRVKRGDSLFHMGDGFHSLYIVRSGTFKSSTLLEDGRDQVTGFSMSGDILGFDSIGLQAHQSDCVALEDSEVCVLPYEHVLACTAREPALQRDFHRLMSREITREQSMMALLGSMQADERVAMFLTDLANRHQARGLSQRTFILRMTREEIGSYLGLKLETVSRILTRFQAAGLISLSNSRQVTILNAGRLSHLLSKEDLTVTDGVKASVRPVPARSLAVA